MSLFDFIDAPSHCSWIPEAPPCLDGIHEIELDCETTGLKWFEKHRPIGISIATPDGKTQYLPWGHRGGGNLDETTVKRWAQRELRRKRITNLNIRFDIHMLREWGVDLEAQGNEVSDVGHYAALLDDHRQHFSLASLVEDFLEGEEKVTRVGSIHLDPTRMADYHAGVIAVRAEADVRQVQKLKKLFWPRLDAEDLQRVRALEDEIIYVVCEMEKNGARIDHRLLDTWIEESQRQFVKCCTEISRLTGLRVNPTSPTDLKKLFKHLKLDIILTEKGNASFTGAILKRINHPVITLVQRATKLASLRSKYLLAYQKALDSKGILRYALHQLRAQKSPLEIDKGEAGTVSGRFSSTEIVEDIGVNIQQVIKAAKQRVMWGYDEEDLSHDEELFLVRQLIIPENGAHLSADAMQVEYRIFGSHTRSKRIIDAYRDDLERLRNGQPLLSFHKLIHSLIKPYKPDLTYRRQKDLNFAKIYGAGLAKSALMLDFITQEQFNQLRDMKAGKYHPLLKQMVEIDQIYNRELPEAKPLLDKAKKLAEERGYVKTILGRRTRFPGGSRIHKALNGVIQGTAADIMKQKLVDLHKARHETDFVLRWTVHDEVDGDARTPETKGKVSEILNSQSFPQLAIPILWEVSTGKNWKECA